MRTTVAFLSLCAALLTATYRSGLHRQRGRRHTRDFLRLNSWRSLIATPSAPMVRLACRSPIAIHAAPGAPRRDRLTASPSSASPIEKLCMHGDSAWATIPSDSPALPTARFRQPDTAIRSLPSGAALFSRVQPGPLPLTEPQQLAEHSFNSPMPKPYGSSIHT